LVVNLASVNFMDSTGLGVLVGVWHRLGARHSSLALAAPSRQIQRILDTTGLTKMLAAMTSRQTPCKPAGSRPADSRARDLAAVS
jgi:anti-sigma B factor antagonist